MVLWEDYQQFVVDKYEVELYWELDQVVEVGCWDGDCDSWFVVILDMIWC